MRNRTKRNARPRCICEDIPVGTVLNYDVDRNRLEHLHYLASGNLWLDEPYICPYTGIIWLSRYVEGRDWRVDDIVYERTRHRQPQLESYTVSKATLEIYHEKRLKKEYITPVSVGDVPLSTMESEWPRFPVAGLLLDLFILSEENRIAWHYEEIVIEPVYSIQLWVYLPSPLWQGDAGRCWLASPFEPITQQVLQPGLVLQWQFVGQIGEIRVEAQQKVPAARFLERFGFDKPYRDIGEELSMRLNEVRQLKG